MQQPPQFCLHEQAKIVCPVASLVTGQEGVNLHALQVIDFHRILNKSCSKGF